MGSTGAGIAVRARTDGVRAGDRQAASRLDTVDLLRGFSIFGVVLLHASLWLSFGGFEVGTSFPRWLRYLVFSQGGNGVSIFFAISGFLITYVSSQRFGDLAAMRVGLFYRLRFARIAPLLGLVLLIFGLMHLEGASWFRIRHGSLPGAFFSALTFQLNWYEARHGWLPAPWTVLWSLSVEEMFYLAFPLICVGLLRWRWLKPMFFVVLAGLVAIGPFARQPWYTTNEIWSYQSYLGNLDNVALGCFFALLTRRLERLGRPIGSLWPRVCEGLGTLLILFVVVWDWPKVILGWHVKRAIGRSGTDVTILGVGTCLLIMGSVLRRAKGASGSLPLRWLGRYSYEVYLTHELVVMMVLSCFLQWRRGPVALWITMTVLLSAGLGASLSRWFSEPMNRKLRGAILPAALP